MNTQASDINLPSELVMHIIRYSQPYTKKIYIMNKEFTREQLKLRYNEIVSFSKMPIFKVPVFSYYSFIKVFEFSILIKDSINKWINFPFSEMINCTSVVVSVAQIHIGLLYVGHDDMSAPAALNPLILNMFDGISRGIPNLKSLELLTSKHLDVAHVLEYFKDGMLTKLSIDSLTAECYPIINKMSALKSLNLSKPKETHFYAILQNITCLKLDSCISTLQGLFNISATYPSLKMLRLGNVDGPGVLNLDAILPLVPQTVEVLEVIDEIESLSPRSSINFSGALIFRAARTEEAALRDLETLKRYSTKWMLAIGIPVFFVVTNMPNFFTFLEQFDESWPYIYTDTCRSFSTQKVNDFVSVHISGRRRRKDQLKAGFGLAVVENLTKKSEILNWAKKELGVVETAFITS